MNQNYNVNKKDLDANLVEKKRLELLLKKAQLLHERREKIVEWIGKVSLLTSIINFIFSWIILASNPNNTPVFGVFLFIFSIITLIIAGNIERFSQKSRSNRDDIEFELKEIEKQIAKQTAEQNKPLSKQEKRKQERVCSIQNSEDAKIKKEAVKIRKEIFKLERELKEIRDITQITESKEETLPEFKNNYLQQIVIDDEQENIPTEDNISIAPENFFSTVRKIDWDALNETRKHHGDLGEDFVFEMEKAYLVEARRPDLAEMVRKVSDEGDGHGYDILSYFANGQKKYVEVKATSAINGPQFNLSLNEAAFLKNHINSAFVYHVHNIKDEQLTTVKVYSAEEIITDGDIKPSGYVVRMN